MLAAAERVFAERGYVAASMDEIAERVGVSKPMLYEYFGSKEGLMIGAIRQSRAELRAVTEEAALGATSGEEVLRRGLVAFFTFISDHRQAWSLLRNESALIGGSASTEVEATRRQQTDLMLTLLAGYLPLLRTPGPMVRTPRWRYSRTGRGLRYAIDLVRFKQSARPWRNSLFRVTLRQLA
jgi:AcrR family transcriptional regulator